ncbi:MAG: glycoside hydrolase family 3 C-terminal domain-containing protein [Luteolibacter sp.]
MNQLRNILIITLLTLPCHSRANEAEIERRVEEMMAKLTVERKIDLIGGVDGFYIRSLPEIGLPKMRLMDASVGVRSAGPSTAYAASIALAATWNPELAQEVGTGIGRDARARGAHFLLGPGVNIYRAPQGGRNFEYLGEDPLLAARLAVGYIRGIQSQGVIATVKHFMGNNSEFDRHHTNSIIDERTKREIYLPAFEAAVKEADVGAIMSSYNLVDGTYASHHKPLLEGVLKGEWGFRGIVMSDWSAVHDGIAAANAGMDLEMPSASFMNRELLLPALKDDRVSQATIDDKVRRILRTALRFGFFERQQQDLTIPLNDPRGRELAAREAEESIVLLKNEGILPLKKDSIRKIAVIGPSAYPAVVGGGGSSQVTPFAGISALEGITDFLGKDAVVMYDRGLLPMSEVLAKTRFTPVGGGSGPAVKIEQFSTNNLSGLPVSIRSSNGIALFAEDPTGPDELGQPFSSVRYTTTLVPEKSGMHHFFANVSTRDGYRLFLDDQVILSRSLDKSSSMLCHSMPLLAGRTYVLRFEVEFGQRWGPNKVEVGEIANEDLLTPTAQLMAAQADVAVVVAGYDTATEAESYDRTFALPVGQDPLIQSVAALNTHTIVALVAGGAVDTAGWLDRVPALLHLWYPGQEGGRALAKVLFGEISPSGHLPISWEKTWAENPVHHSYYINGKGNDVHYSEGVFVGYRGYEQNRIKPLFPFGYGMSYSSFRYTNLKISPQNARIGETVSLSFDVTNAGNMLADDVAQLYLGDPVASVPRPPKELKGFQRVSLKPGETTTVSFLIDPRARSFYDITTKEWKQEPGAFTVFVGPSSAEIPLTGTFQVKK